MYPVVLRIGPLTIYSYGLMMAIAFLTAGYLAGREFSRKGLNGELASTMVLWAAVGGLVGARIFAIFGDWHGFVADPIHTLFGGAGFVWYGGFIGGVIAVTWAIHRYALPWLVAVDCMAPGLALGHGIGRIGCQLAGDGDWGRPTTLPWGMAYPNAIIGWHYPPGVRVHPAPLYELFAYAMIFAFLWSIRKRRHPAGTLFWLYLLLAPGARFLIEFVRINPRILTGLTEAQLMSLALMAIGAWKLLSARVHPGTSLTPSKR
ncbi:MAG: prolipoprotein diacylglyceryl transferase [Candidatus Binatia bacterium]